MRESKPHGFVAWVFDFYIVSFVLGAVVASILALSKVTGEMWMSFGVLGATLLVSLVYHLGIAKQVLWLSPGEMIAGRFVEVGKTWRNPYRLTRWPLFVVMLLVTILAGNTWDGIGRGVELHVWKVALDAIALVALVMGLVAAGRGNAWGMLAPAGYSALLVVTALRATATYDVPSGTANALAMFFACCAVLCVATGAWYARLREPVAA